MSTRRMMMGISAGLLVSAGASLASAEIILDVGSFDAPTSLTIGWPSTLGIWGGDAASVVGAQSGITPRSGSGMLRFDSAGGGGASRYSSSDLYRTIDVSAYTDWIANGTLRVTAESWVNRVAGDSQTDTQFGVGLRAFSGSPSQFPSVVSNGYLDMARSFLQSDADTGTWERVSVELIVPQGTDYISVWVAPQENIFNDITGIEFDGQFVDDITVGFSQVPAPGTLVMAGVGGLIAMRRRRSMQG